MGAARDNHLYNLARKEHAFLLRCEGLKYREIGPRLGVGSNRARLLTLEFERRLRKVLRQAKFYVLK